MSLLGKKFPVKVGE
jgi:hypothetical protein